MDIVNKCKDCRAQFKITAKHAQWYTAKGLSLPQRCPECIAKRKAERTYKK